ncbi:N-acyl homoserine lactonase family protein [Bacillus sp. FJAT-50079]|uniref:N-acyl homoserine lactonase family protein n=1 Tax=Bacillus sp. FJAT-50079 TaxID=2833577 RepID=UPI001BC8D76A|nr:N-acyl homoserine lactonase family protein [Bacillus sp. FJAT-50079]MBS4210584.1 N-acyl homoserine lactonase family protein [Bacillus sp. FJAT-50079]
MALEIRIINTGDVELDASRNVFGHNPGTLTKVPVYSFLILGGEKPILVDTGFHSPEVMAPRGCKAYQTEEQKLINQLQKYGLKPSDIGYLIHTHCHIDHTGRDIDFPDSVIVMQRREMETSVTGLMGGVYRYEDIAYLLKRVYQPGSVWMLDGDLSGPQTIIPGVKCVFARGHSEGSQFIYVETSKGTAVICGDVIYNIELQTQHYRKITGNYWPSGNHVWTKKDEVAAIAKLVEDADYLLPSHDYAVMEKYGDRII